MEAFVFPIHLGLTLYMTGLIWFVQVVHYPLMAWVGKEDFVAYEQAHTSKTFWVTAPPMILELGTAGWWWWLETNYGVWPLVNFIGAIALWASTFFIQVPLHEKLSQQHSEGAIQKLVRSNWIRTVLWTARGILLLWLTFLV